MPANTNSVIKKVPLRKTIQNRKHATYDGHDVAACNKGAEAPLGMAQPALGVASYTVIVFKQSLLQISNDKRNQNKAGRMMHTWHVGVEYALTIHCRLHTSCVCISGWRMCFWTARRVELASGGAA